MHIPQTDPLPMCLYCLDMWSEQALASTISHLSMPASQFLPVNAIAGQAFTHKSQERQPDFVTGSPTGKSQSVNTVPRRTLGPNSGVTSNPFFPTQPNPDLVAAVLCEKKAS